MSQNAVPLPSINRVSFSCPHCGAHATQGWLSILGKQLTNRGETPRVIPTENEISNLEEEIEGETDPKRKAVLKACLKYSFRLLAGEPFFDGQQTAYQVSHLANVNASRCFTCSRIALWLHDKMIYPAAMAGPAPNPDLPDDVMRDYEEARTILDLSPRGAAALLRLAVEKICVELKAEGKTIDERIAYLVSQGLPITVQRALDVVRVIGNEAVHPGKLDLRDDRGTAMALFGLVNFIVQDQITRPKEVENLYQMIPEEKRKGIEARNNKVLGKSKNQ